MKIFINGTGIAGGFGCGSNALLNRLRTGATCEPSSQDGYYPAFYADISSLYDFVPKKALRRIDHFSQLALTGAYLALNDAGQDSFDKMATGLILCSGYGSAKTTFSFLDSIIDSGDNCASPTLFSNSVHNAAAGHISMMLGIEGPCLTISQFEMSVSSGLLSAIQWLCEERVGQVLFGAVDEYFDVLGYCYKRWYGSNGNISMSPLAAEIQSAVPGEGAAFFLLSRDKSANCYGAVTSVNTGIVKDLKDNLSEDSFYILNADGHIECDRYYSEIIPEGSLVSCYTPYYGSIPVGSAFDMVIAVISLREGRIFPAPVTVRRPDNYRFQGQDCTLNQENISCVKTGIKGEFSIITLSHTG
ncbi:MAG: beta-ketoacyl synthase [Desulfatiglans sp.]|nr:beta-ketoacyl synthase [Desulfatiglans sp.]